MHDAFAQHIHGSAGPAPDEADRERRNIVGAPLPSYPEQVERVVQCVGVRTDTGTVWLNLLNGRVARASVPKNTVDRWLTFLRDQTQLRVFLKYLWNPTSLRMTRTRVTNAEPIGYRPVDHVTLIRAMAAAFQAVEPDPEPWFRSVREAGTARLN